MEALQKNATWKLISVSVEKTIVGCRGYLERSLIQMSQLTDVRRGWLQPLQFDYDETFAPSANFNIARILILTLAHKDWPLHREELVLNVNLKHTNICLCVLRQPM